MTTTSSARCKVRRYRLSGGRREGVEVIEVDNGAMRLSILPQRGMGLWKVELGGQEFGWRSPVSGPVHPAFVPWNDASGLGWLEGFDELMCRCGLQSNGPPVFHANGSLAFPLHGRIANLPAEDLDILHDEATGQVTVTGVVLETRFLQFNLRLTSTVVIEPQARGFRLHDEVTNLGPTLVDCQLMYHYNIGLPVLDAGSELVAPIRELAPRDARAAEGIPDWHRVQAQQLGFAEQVFYSTLNSRADGGTSVLLKSSDGSTGTGIQFNVRQLPCFVIWKHCADARDGYVMGMEPSTNFPNPRPFEIEHGRSVPLVSGERVNFDLRFDFFVDKQALAAAELEVRALQSGGTSTIHAQAKPGWSPGA